MSADLIPVTEFKALNARKISADTCRHFGYFVTTRKNETIHVAPYRDADGNIVAQHLRTANKDFPWVGDPKNAVMFGQHLWRDAGKMVVVTEGEIDCMSVSQAQGNKWPVVSIGCGAGEPNDEGRVPKVSNYIGKHVAWLERFEKVVFMFDMDEQGRASAKAAAAVLSPGKAFIASLPEGFKDASDLLQAGRGGDIIDAVWGAKAFRPDGLVFLDDLEEVILEDVELGLPWFLPSLTAATYGRQWGQAVALGAGTGIGKTDFVTQQVVYDVTVLNQKVGLIYLEQPVKETGKRLAGKFAGKRFHIPAEHAGWTKSELADAVKAVKGDRRVALYDHFGQCDWEFLKSHIRYLNKAHSIRIFYLDHLTALAAAEEDEKKALERIMAQLSGLCQELGIWLLFISHLATPEGKPHEEGGRVMIRHFKGSRAIGFWSHFMFGMERDQQHEDPLIAGTTIFRILKDRFTGNSTGLVIYLKYDRDTGLLEETTKPPEKSPFKDETLDDDL